MRICSKCKISKEVSEFSERKNSKDGLNRKCKKCVNETKSIWASNNVDKIILSREKRKEKIKEGRKRWHEKNPDYSKNYKRKYSRAKRLLDRMKTDKILACKIKISKLIGQSIKRHANKNRNYVKLTKTTEILGCSHQDFVTYIESKFESWMKWENHGLYNGNFNYGWDFDHIIPLCSASSEDEVYKLNHYTNIQPLCSKINRDIKRNK
jgi:hypothetical protein